MRDFWLKVAVSAHLVEKSLRGDFWLITERAASSFFWIEFFIMGDQLESFARTFTICLGACCCTYPPSCIAIGVPYPARFTKNCTKTHMLTVLAARCVGLVVGERVATLTRFTIFFFPLVETGTAVDVNFICIEFLLLLHSDTSLFGKIADTSIKYA